MCIIVIICRDCILIIPAEMADAYRSTGQGRVTSGRRNCTMCSMTSQQPFGRHLHLFYVRSERTSTQRKFQSATHYVKSIPSITECTVRRAMRASSDLPYHQETHLEAYFVAPFSLGRGKPPNGGSVCNSPSPPLTGNDMLQPGHVIYGCALPSQHGRRPQPFWARRTGWRGGL